MQKKYRDNKSKNKIPNKKNNSAAIIAIAVLAVIVAVLAVILIIQTVNSKDLPSSNTIEPPACSDNKTYEIGKFSYKILDDGTAMITECSFDKTVKELFIPSEIDGKRVSAIGDSAFELMTWLTSVDIPEGVEYLGKQAFAFCGMTSVNLPSTLKAIQNDAFKSCDIKLVRFNGTSSEWKKVTVGSGNIPLTRQVTFLKK